MKNEVNYEDVAHVWRDLGFEDKDVLEITISPVDVTVTTLNRSEIALAHETGCGPGCRGIASTNHSFRITHPEHQKLLDDMSADAEVFENVEMS